MLISSLHPQQTVSLIKIIQLSVGTRSGIGIGKTSLLRGWSESSASIQHYALHCQFGQTW